VPAHSRQRAATSNWRTTVLPVYGRSCADCHAPGGVSGVALVARAELPPWLSSVFELAVAVMLLGLGVRGLWVASRLGRHGPEIAHHHGPVSHAHAGPSDHMHAGRWTLARRPFLIGLVHGLAGSGALTAWAVASAKTQGGGLLYVLAFGIGSVAGMAALTGALGASLRRWVREPRGQVRLAAASGGFSILLSLAWGYEPLLALAS